MSLSLPDSFLLPVSQPVQLQLWLSGSLSINVPVFVCVSVTDRQKGGPTDRETGRQRGRETERQTHADRQKAPDREADRQKEREGDR